MAAKQTKAVPEKPGRLIYLGPNLLKFGLQTYQVYKGGKPKILEKVKETYPLIGQLFAPVQNASGVMQAIEAKGTPANLAYRQITGKGEK